ncbi:MAG: heparinase II/III domain-containing protein [Bacteroidales bacterium]
MIAKQITHILKLISLLVVLFVNTNVYAQVSKFSPHPRLLFTPADEADVRSNIATDPLAKELSIFLKEKADSVILIPQIPYQKDKHGNILSIARSYVFRLTTLATAYRIYGDPKYADAVNRILLYICQLPDWSPKHYLDTSELSTGVAIAYDWLYDVLPETTKEIVRKTLYERALSVVLNEYENGKVGSWAKRETNWNVVCNAGMTMAALAVAEDYPEEVNTILKNAAQYIPNCMKHFAPDGVCYEGPAYWGYTTAYLSVYLKAVMENGGDKGKISHMEGIPRTALFYKRTLTPAGQRFNFGNAGNEEINSPAFFFFGKHYNQPEVSEWYRKELTEVIRKDKSLHQLFFLCLPWFDTAVANRSAKLPPAEVYRNSINDLIVLNGNREEKGSVFLIAKGGEPGQAHQQMDCGTFIIESDSVCWSEDPGADDYSLPGFWDYKQGGKRWSYFRNNNLSHNTLSINGNLQHAEGKAFICEDGTQCSQPFVTLDLSSLYAGDAKSVSRTFHLMNDRNVCIEDNVILEDPESYISWRMLSKAEIHTDDKKAYLTRDGKRFYLKILSPDNASFKSYPAKNNFEIEYPVRGLNILEAVCRFEGEKGKIIIQLSSIPE